MDSQAKITFLEVLISSRKEITMLSSTTDWEMFRVPTLKFLVLLCWFSGHRQQILKPPSSQTSSLKSANPWISIPSTEALWFWTGEQFSQDLRNSLTKNPRIQI